MNRNQDKTPNQKLVIVQQCGEMSHFQQHPVIFPRQRQLQRSLELVQRLGRADHGAELLPVGGGRQELGSGVSISCHVSRVTCHVSPPVIRGTAGGAGARQPGRRDDLPQSAALCK